MRRLKEREVIILLFLLALVTTMGISQRIRRSSPKQELLKIARETVAMWHHELELTAAQRKQVGTVITTYSGKKNKILTSDLGSEAQAHALKILQKEEHNRMANILTNKQYNRYISITRTRIFGPQKSPMS